MQKFDWAKSHKGSQLRNKNKNVAALQKLFISCSRRIPGKNIWDWNSLFRRPLQLDHNAYWPIRKLKNGGGQICDVPLQLSIHEKFDIFLGEKIKNPGDPVMPPTTERKTVNVRERERQEHSITHSAPRFRNVSNILPHTLHHKDTVEQRNRYTWSNKGLADSLLPAQQTRAYIDQSESRTEREKDMTTT